MSNITGNPFDKQIKNRNFLSAVGFKFTIVRSPKVAFFGNSINIPSLSVLLAKNPETQDPPFNPPLNHTQAFSFSMAN